MERNLNDIIPPSRRRAMEGGGADSFAPQAQAPRHESPRPEPRAPRTPRTRARFPLGTALVALVVVLLSAGALYAFSKATVNVTPVVNKAILTNADFTADAGGGNLPFVVITVEKEGTKEAKSEGTENVSEAAQGTVTLTNTQAVPQQLIKNTRFESADGHIFRIHDSVTVPAAKGGAPGTLMVTVYADAPGDSFNIAPTTFKVPGLKGSKAYDQVTGKSDAPMAGGFVGARPVVPQATKDKEYAAIKESLTGEITKAIGEKVEQGYVLMPGATFITYVPVPDQPAAGGSVTLSLKAVATAVVFPSDALAKSIAYQSVGSYAGQSVTLGDVSGLMLTSSNGAAPSASDTEFSFKVSGDVSVVWQVDAQKVAGAVAGKTRESAQVALAGFPEIDRAHLVLRPFWANAFPSDPGKIQVTVSGPTDAK